VLICKDRKNIAGVGSVILTPGGTKVMAGCIFFVVVVVTGNEMLLVFDE
jgi:hypothetical protein